MFIELGFEKKSLSVIISFEKTHRIIQHWRNKINIVWFNNFWNCWVTTITDWAQFWLNNWKNCNKIRSGLAKKCTITKDLSQICFESGISGLRAYQIVYLQNQIYAKSTGCLGWFWHTFCDNHSTDILLI